MSVGSCVHAAPASQAPAHWSPQPSATPQRTPGGQRGTHTQRRACVSHTCPDGHSRPMPHEGPPGHALATSVPHATEFGSTVHAGVQVQVPAEQYVRPAQMVPHIPQLLLSPSVLTQCSPQRVRGVGHTQTPDAQAVPKGHSTPQVPQWLLSPRRSTHRPPQGVRPGAQVTSMAPPSPPPPPGGASEGGPPSMGVVSQPVMQSQVWVVVLQRWPGPQRVPVPHGGPSVQRFGTSEPQG